MAGICAGHDGTRREKRRLICVWEMDKNANWAVFHVPRCPRALVYHRKSSTLPYDGRLIICGLSDSLTIQFMIFVRMAAGSFALPRLQHHKCYKYSHNKMSYLARSFASDQNNNDKSGGTKDGNKDNNNAVNNGDHRQEKLWIPHQNDLIIKIHRFGCCCASSSPRQ